MKGQIKKRFVVFVVACFATISWLLFKYHDSHPQLQISSVQAVFPPHPGGCPTHNNGFGTPDLCVNFPHHRLADVQVVFKTGIGEREKARTALSTFASCISNILVVSDAEDTLAGRNVVDVLADLPPSYAVDNPDWSAYSAQHSRLEAGGTIDKSQEGWKLDRFKFLPMVEAAYEQAPNAKWYVFIETDVYMFWDPLFRLLDTLQHHQRHYFGLSIAGANNVWFAYGGAGFVLSHRLVADLINKGGERLSLRHEQMAKDDCCGDAVLAYAIYADLGVRVGSLYPTFSGDELFSLSITPEKWCAPLISLHRVTPDVMIDLWHWERCRDSTQDVVTYSTIAQHSLPLLNQAEASSTFWDNQAGEGELVKDIQNAAECVSACKHKDRCVQTTYKSDECYHADFIRVGSAAQEPTVSSWNLTRVADLAMPQATALECKSIGWSRPSVWLPPDTFLGRIGLNELYYKITT